MQLLAAVKTIVSQSTLLADIQYSYHNTIKAIPSSGFPAFVVNESALDTIKKGNNGNYYYVTLGITAHLIHKDSDTDVYVDSVADTLLETLFATPGFEYIELERQELDYGAISTRNVKGFTFNMKFNYRAAWDGVPIPVDTTYTMSFAGNTTFGDSVYDRHERTGSMYISGSLIVDGDFSVDSSSFATTASYANFATTASYAVSASHEITQEITSSFAEFATSASHALTASFALNAGGGAAGLWTGSFDDGHIERVGDVGISGSFYVKSYGNELVTNGNFGSDITGWTGQSSTISHYTTDDDEIGRVDLMKSISSGTVNSADYTTLSTPLKTGKTYKISLDVYIPSANTKVDGFAVSFVTPVQIFLSSYEPTADSWVTYTTYYTSTRDFEKLYLYKTNGGSKNDVAIDDIIYWDNVSVVEVSTFNVSGSNVYFDGSTKFGNIADDIHQFTGSFRQSGSDSYFMNNVGIGITDPQAQLDVAGSTKFGNSVNNIHQFTGSLDVLRTGTGYEDLLTLENTGDPGTGGSGLRLKNSVSTLLFRAYGSSSPDILGSAAGILALAGSSFLIGGGASMPIYIYSYNNYSSPELTIKSSRVGIGITNPTEKLHIYGDGRQTLKVESFGTSSDWAGLLVENDEDAQGNLVTYSSDYASTLFGTARGNYTALMSIGANSEGLMLGAFTNKPIILGTNNTERMRILGDGKVGIGKTDPDNKLVVIPAASNDGIFVRETDDGYDAVAITAGAGSGKLSCYQGAVGETVRLTGASANSWINGGNVGIGTTTPRSKLDVAGSTTLGSSNAHVLRISGSLRMAGTTVEPFVNWYGYKVGNFEITRFQNWVSPATGRGLHSSYYIGQNEYASVDVLIGATTAQSEMIFKTRKIGEANPEEKMRISEDGNIGIGTNDPSSSKLWVWDADGGDTSITTYGQRINLRKNHPVNLVTQYGLRVDSSEVGGGANSNIYGIYAKAQKEGSFGTVTMGLRAAAYHSWSQVATSGNNLNLYGVHGETHLIGSSSNVIANAYSIFSAGSVEANRFLEDYYGLYVSAPTVNGTITNQYALVTSPTAGNVGIGTTHPAQPLHIIGNTRVDGTIYNNGTTITRTLLVGYSSYDANISNQTTDEHLYIYNTGTGSINLQTKGDGSNVGIGTDDPQEQLHVWNNVSASAFYGDGSNLTGISTESTGAYGEMNIQDNTDATDLAQNIWQRVSGLNAGNLSNSTYSGSTLQVGVTGIYKINWAASTAASAADVIQLGIGVDGSTPISESIIERKYGGGDIGASAGSLIHQLTSGSLIDFQAINTANSNDVTVKFANITLNTVAGGVLGESASFAEFANVAGTVLGSIESASYADYALSSSYASNAYWTASGGDIHRMGNVGIGKTNPTSKLHVSGTTFLDGRVTIDTDGGIQPLYITRKAAINESLKIYVDDQTAFLEVMQDETGGDFGNMTFRIDDDSTLASSFRFQGKSAEEYMRITRDGNVGIGTTDPQALLHISGNYGDSNGITFGDGDIKIYEAADDQLHFKLGGGLAIQMLDTGIAVGPNSNYPTIRKEIPTATNPVFTPTYADDNTGMGWAGTNTGSLIAGGTNVLNWLKSGRVGIGTTDPQYTLDVVGSVKLGNAASNTHIMSGSLVIRGTNNSAEPLVRFHGQKVGKLSALTLHNFTAVGTGRGVVMAFSESNTAYGSIDVIGGTTAANENYMSFNTRTGGNVGERMRISEDGYVGIGTTNPSALLHVYEAGATNARIIIEDTAQNAYLSLTRGASTSEIRQDANDLAIIPYRHILMLVGDDNVGIGTATPSTKLHTVGSTGLTISSSAFYPLILHSNGSGVGMQLNNNGVLQWNIYADATGNFIFHDGSNAIVTIEDNADANTLYIDDTSQVGIGTSSPQEKLHVLGNVSASAFYGDGSNLDNVTTTSASFADYAMSASHVLEADTLNGLPSSSFLAFDGEAQTAVSASHASFATSASYSPVPVIRQSHTYAIASGSVEVRNEPPFFVGLPSGQTKEISEVKYMVSAGTANFDVTLNGAVISGYNDLLATSSPTGSASVTQVLSDGDYIGMIIGSQSVAEDFTATILIDNQIQ